MGQAGSTYREKRLCILIVVNVFLDAATLTEVITEGITSQDGARPALSHKLLCSSVYCLCVNVCCTVLN